HVVGELQHMAAKNKENYLWWDNGVSELKGHMEGFLAAYKAIGGLLDGVVIDFETGMSRDYLQGIAASEATALAKAQWSANKPDGCTCTDYSYHTSYCSTYDSSAYSALRAERYTNMGTVIANDARFADILPELMERGFTNTKNDWAVTITDLISRGYSTNNIYPWDVVMGRRVSSYLNEGLFDVVAQYYPEASGSDYGSTDSNAANMIAGNGHPFYKAGNSQKAGTHSSFSLYGTYITNKNQYWQDDASYAKSGFSLLKYEVNAMKASMLATEEGAIQPWIANPQFGYQSTTKDKNGNITKNTKTSYTGNTPWYRELVFHVGLLNPDPFLYWGPRYYGTDTDEYVQKNAQMLSDMIDELNSVAGYSQRKPLSEGMDSWNTDFILTGMQVGDSAGSKNIWRITPNLEVKAMYNLKDQTVVTEGITGVTRESFCLDNTTPTFKIEGTTITFPQGTIIEEKNIIDFDAKTATGSDLYYSYEDESYGYWVETPVGVMPTVTYDPAFYTVSDAGFKTDILVYEEDGTQTTVLPTEGEVTVRLSYQNLSGDMQDAKLFFAVYNGNTLLDIKTLYEGSIQFGEDGYKICELGALPDGADTVQLLLWDGVENLKPLKAAKILK
ncbi:MAG: hypothetical protein IKL80_04660, partial [Clostridia bacterium]|nr:hypothetical protein [Clostridia bacterium]